MSTENLMNLLQLKTENKESEQLQKEFVAMRDFIKQFEFARETAKGRRNGTYIGEFNIDDYIKNVELAYNTYLIELSDV